jgi:hypothetical protein
VVRHGPEGPLGGGTLNPHHRGADACEARSFSPGPRMFLDILVRLCSNTQRAAADCGGTPQRTTGRFATRGPRQPRETEKGERPASRGRLRRPLEQFVGRSRLWTTARRARATSRERTRRVQALNRQFVDRSWGQDHARQARWSWRGQATRETHDTRETEERASEIRGTARYQLN